MKVVSSRRAAALALLAAAALAGCNSHKRLTVTGTVTYKGRPLPSGIVRFYFGPGGDRMSMATIEADGSFAATDVPPGPVKVTVEPDPQAAKHRSMGGANEPAPKPVTIPPKYADPKTSGLEYSISDGANKLDVKLE